MEAATKAAVEVLATLPSSFLLIEKKIGVIKGIYQGQEEKDRYFVISRSGIG